tara:strand:+ start:173 stop:664 length:492 start_codon:yes stop_codon:yes gene_type:complete
MSCSGDPTGVAPSLDGVEYLAVASREHTDHDLDYPTRPPAGGDHLGIWHNCGVYTVPLLDEAAVHSLEHGAVWVTYRPDLGAEAILGLTGQLLGREKLLVSPHPDQTPPVVATAWARQLVLDGPDDPRLEAFIDRFTDGDAAPEAQVTCQGGIGRPPADPYGR